MIGPLDWLFLSDISLGIQVLDVGIVGQDIMVGLQLQFEFLSV